MQTGLNPSYHAKVCTSLAIIYLESKNKDLFNKYMERARDIYYKLGDTAKAVDLDKKINSERMNDDVQYDED